MEKVEPLVARELWAWKASGSPICNRLRSEYRRSVPDCRSRCSSRSVGKAGVILGRFSDHSAAGRREHDAAAAGAGRTRSRHAGVVGMRKLNARQLWPGSNTPQRSIGEVQRLASSDLNSLQMVCMRSNRARRYTRARCAFFAFTTQGGQRAVCPGFCLVGTSSRNPRCR